MSVRVAIFMAVAACCIPGLVVSAPRGATSEYRIIGSDIVDESRLLAIARSFMKQHLGESFAQLWIVGKKSDLSALTGAPLYHPDFQMLVRNALQSEPFPVARVVVSNQDAVLDIQLRTNEWRRRVLNGSNPMLVTIGRRQFHIVHVFAGRDEDKEDVVSIPTLTAFATTTGKPTHTEIDQFWHLLRGRFTNVGGLVVREQPFYIAPVVPVRLPFGPFRPPKSEAEFLGGWQFNCQDTGAREPCRAN